MQQGVTYIRRMANGRALVWNPTTTLVTIAIDPKDRQMFNYSQAKRMSRGMAHRVVNAMEDASEPQKKVYHGWIDEGVRDESK